MINSMIMPGKKICTDQDQMLRALQEYMWCIVLQMAKIHIILSTRISVDILKHTKREVSEASNIAITLCYDYDKDRLTEQ